VLAGAAVASLVMAYAATVENEGASFSMIFRFVVIPMTLFSGTFFPVDRLPEWVQPLAWVSPLWHGTVLARDAALDVWRPLPALGHIAYLAVLLAVGIGLIVRLYTRRLSR
jgi:lipooligosaccharide transport system permease protein